MDNFYIFGLNLGKLPNNVEYFGSNIVEGVAESWVEAEMSWVEVDGAGWRWVHGLVIPVLERNKLERKIRQSLTLLTFRDSLLKIGQPAPKLIYNKHNPNGLELLTRLRLGLSHLNEHLIIISKTV